MINIDDTRLDHEVTQAIRFFNAVCGDWNYSDTTRRRYIPENLDWCADWLNNAGLKHCRSAKAIRKLIREIRKNCANRYDVRQINVCQVYWWRDFSIGERLRAIEAMLRCDIGLSA